MAAGTQVLPSRYANAQKIARGGMGEIYVAEDQTLGRKVAVKLLAERFSRDESVRRRFTREALASARLSGHPHIVTIFDVGEYEGRPFIVMEYLSAGTLADRARSGAVAHDQVIEWLKQAADALDDAHRQGIVHRDVKPANLLFDERRQLHVGDFGIARVVDEGTTGMTMAGTVLGTAGYLAPEQARGEPATAASDVYSLGIVAYELLTGGRPFEGGSSTAEAAAHIHQPVPPASERGVGLTREVDAVFERVLSKDPTRRYRTARDFVRALCLALELEAEPTAVPAPTRVAAAGAPAASRYEAPTPVPVRRKKRSYLPALVAAALVALAVTGVVLATVVSGGDGREAAAESTVKESTAKGGQTSVVTRKVTVTAPGTTVRATVTQKQTPTSSVAVVDTPETTASSGVSMGEAIALTDQAYSQMQAGAYSDAIVLARKALTRLAGTGHIYEAYANYQLGNSLVRSGNCADGLAALDRSEAIQGQRDEIDAARARCE